MTTYCQGCGKALIVRDGYAVCRYELTPEGRCPHCFRAVPGRFRAKPGTFGNRRLPVHIGR